MNKIYVVKGSSGQYSDWATWDVCAYTTEKSAQKQVKKLTANKNEVIKTLNLNDENWLFDLPKDEVERLEKLGIITRNSDALCVVGCCEDDNLWNLEDTNFTYKELELKDE